MSAVNGGHGEWVEVLVHAGADVNATSNVRCVYAMYAMYASSTSARETTSWIACHFVSQTFRCPMLCTLFLYVMYFRECDVLYVNVIVGRQDGKSVLKRAGRHPQIAAFLRANGAR